MSHPLTPFLAEIGDIVGLLLLIILFIAFILERLAPVVVAVVGGVTMMLLGFVRPDELLSVFASPAPITIGAMFVISGALLRTGTLEAVSGWVLRRATRNPRLAVAEVGAGTFLASGLMNNTPVVIVMIPIVKRLAAALGVSATRLLIPLSYISILGGTLTLIGTSTNLLVDGVAQAQGQAAFTIFEITGVGLIGALAGAALLAIMGPALLPDRPETSGGERGGSDHYLSHLLINAESAMIGLPIQETSLHRRQGVRILAVQRGRKTLRRDIEKTVLAPGDQLVIAASAAELASLAEEADFRVGLTGVSGGISMRGPGRPVDAEFVEAVVGVAHPIVGRRLADIPLLSRLKVRVLGLARPRHLAGPDLATARVRAGDRLLIAAGADAASTLYENINLAQVTAAPARAFKRNKAPIALAVLAFVIGGAALLGLPIEAVALCGVAIILVTGCIEPEEAWNAIDGNTLVLIFGMLAFGLGLQNAGTVDLVVGLTRPLLAHASPLALLVGVYAITSLLTETVTNNAVAVIMTPLVIALADALNVDARPLVVAVMFGASASFATPIGYQTNTLVYGAANYRFSDFVKIGLPMNIVVGLAVCIAIKAIF